VPTNAGDSLGGQNLFLLESLPRCDGIVGYISFDLKQENLVNDPLGQSIST
jgi:hypothetical protein